MNISLFITWLCIFHLSVFAAMLLVRKPNRNANIALGGFLLTFAFMHLIHAVSISHSLSDFYLLDTFGYIVMLLSGPLYLEYTASMTGYQIHWRKYFLLHTIPFLPATLNFSGFLFKSADDIDRYYEQAVHTQPPVEIFMNSLNALQMGFYIIWSLILVNKYNKTLKKENYLRILDLQWLKHLTILMCILCFVIGPLLEIEGSATLMRSVLPVSTTMIYLVLFYKSVNFPGSEYEKVVIEAHVQEKISRDLHDGVGQLVTAAKMNLDSLMSKLPLEKAEDKFLAEKTSALVEESYNEIRTISHQMKQSASSGLAFEVKSLVEKLNTDTLEINLETIGFKSRIEFTAEAVLFKVIQEAVANVIKHAKASRLDIHLKRENQNIIALVSDNGIGFNPMERRVEGIGLKNINDRIEYLNGEVSFDSAPGKGTNVFIRIPVAN